jgi:hypothetical protein
VRLNVCDDFFRNHLGATLAGRQLLICFNNQGQRVFEVAPNFGKGRALCIYAWNFFDEGDIPFPALFDDRGELPFYIGILAEIVGNDRNGHPRAAKRARPN